MVKSTRIRLFIVEIEIITNNHEILLISLNKESHIKTIFKNLMKSIFNKRLKEKVGFLSRRK